MKKSNTLSAVRIAVMVHLLGLYDDAARIADAYNATIKEIQSLWPTPESEERLERAFKGREESRRDQAAAVRRLEEYLDEMPGSSK